MWESYNGRDFKRGSLIMEGAYNRGSRIMEGVSNVGVL